MVFPRMTRFNPRWIFGYFARGCVQIQLFIISLAIVDWLTASKLIWLETKCTNTAWCNIKLYILIIRANSKVGRQNDLTGTFYTCCRKLVWSFQGHALPNRRLSKRAVANAVLHVGRLLRKHITHTTCLAFIFFRRLQDETRQWNCWIFCSEE